jgi:hypothetical protein
MREHIELLKEQGLPVLAIGMAAVLNVINTDQESTLTSSCNLLVYMLETLSGMSSHQMSPGAGEMKAIIFISLILVVTVSAAMAAETHMTIQTNTTIKIDPATGNIKGDAQTQIRGIKIEPDPAATPAADTSSTGTSTGTTSTTGATSANSDPATTGATGATSSNTAPASTTSTGSPSSTAPCPTCPLAQAPAGQSN